MRKETLLLLMLCSFALASTAQQPPFSRCNANNVNATIIGNGSCYTFFFYATTPDCPIWEVPAGSGKSTVFQHTLWFGGLDTNDSLHLAGFRFGQIGTDYWTGPLRTTDASTNLMDMLKYYRVWNLTRVEINDFIAHHGEPGYAAPDDILTWPAHGDGDFAANLAPFVDVDGDGLYNPEAGDYPDIKGDQCLFFIFNDSYADHTESGGGKLGLEVHAMVYAYDNIKDEALYNTVFVNYEFFNRSANDYHDVYLGLWSDFDIGYGWDDYIGCDVQRGSYYAYNGTPIDGNGEPEAYGDNPPVQVLTILAGPYMDADGRDNPEYVGDCNALFNGAYPADKYAYNGFNFGNGIADDERLGMTGFLYHNNNSYGPNTDPVVAEDYYNFLRGHWKNNTPMMYGGDGLATGNVVGPECNFMFPGDSDPCNFGTNGIAPNDNYNTGNKFWTETECQNAPDDRRGLGMVGPFSFNAGSTQVVDYALTTVWKDNNHSAMERMGDIIDHIKDMFKHGFSK